MSYHTSSDTRTIVVGRSAATYPPQEPLVLWARTITNKRWEKRVTARRQRREPTKIRHWGELGRGVTKPKAEGDGIMYFPVCVLVCVCVWVLVEFGREVPGTPVLQPEEAKLNDAAPVAVEETSREPALHAPRIPEGTPRNLLPSSDIAAYRTALLYSGYHRCIYQQPEYPSTL